MLSRALILATVTLLIGCFAAIPVQAQNLEAGKSPSQIFAGACTACHKSPRGLLKTVPAGSLQGFLRQHYTTSSEMASLLSGFLISNGAADPRYVGTQPKPSRDVNLDARPVGPPDLVERFGRRLRPAAPPDAEPPQAARPDADGLSPQFEPGRRGRNARRLARPAEMPDAATPAVDGQAPVEAAIERGPRGRKSAAKQRLNKRGRPVHEEPPKTDAVGQEPATGEAKDDKPKTEPQGETAKDEGRKPEGAKPPGESTSDSARIAAPKNKVEPSKETGGEAPVLRADPVPAVTPAPPAAPAASSEKSPEPSSAASEPAAQPASPAVTASGPPHAVAPREPPVPPVSQ